MYRLSSIRKKINSKTVPLYGMPFYADIILPLALPKRTYTYEVPDSVRELVMPGVRVEVQFGRSRLYSGLVEKIHDLALIIL